MTLKGNKKQNKEFQRKRGETTKQALIKAGLELFSKHGLNVTSTRMLSKKSGANISAIPYYFRSKEGLYYAVVTYISEQMEKHVGYIVDEINERMSKEKLSKEEANKEYHRLINAFISFFIGTDEPKVWTQILHREQAHPTEAFEILYNKTIKKTQKIFTVLCGVLIDLPSDSLEVKIRVHALSGQILGFLVHQEELLRDLGVKKLSKTHIVYIRTILNAHIEVCLNLEPQLKEV